MSILGTGLKGKKLAAGRCGARETLRSSKLHGRLYAVQQGDDRPERCESAD
jgi:hypothetical protein